jgi:hypothetical protein
MELGNDMRLRQMWQFRNIKNDFIVDTSVTLSEVTCRECHANAECAFLRDLNQYRCQCLSGYRGDGRLKCDKEKSGCNIVNDCGRNSECLYNPYDGTHKCTCKDVRFSATEIVNEIHS